LQYYFLENNSLTAGAVVVTLITLLEAETFPAASFALQKKAGAGS
jgi:hypothetical protein